MIIENLIYVMPIYCLANIGLFVTHTISSNKLMLHIRYFLDHTWDLGNNFINLCVKFLNKNTYDN